MEIWRTSIFITCIRKFGSGALGLYRCSILHKIIASICNAVKIAFGNSFFCRPLVDKADIITMLGNSFFFGLFVLFMKRCRSLFARAPGTSIFMTVLDRTYGRIYFDALWHEARQESIFLRFGGKFLS